MNQNYISTIDEYKRFESSSTIFKNALKELMPHKISDPLFILSILSGFIISAYIGFADNTVELLAETTSTVLTIEVAVFGCLFTVYSIIVAFLSDDMMKRLSGIQSSENSASNKLKEYTSYFESILCLFFIGLSMTGFYCVVGKIISPVFRLTNNLILDNTLASILIFLYCSYTIRLILEIKSTLYNIFMLYRFSIAFKFIAFSKEHEEEINSNDK